MGKVRGGGGRIFFLQAGGELTLDDTMTSQISFKCGKATRWSNFVHKTVVQTCNYVLPESCVHIVMTSSKPV